MKYDSAGVEQWVARYNGPMDTTDTSCGIAVDDAGNVYVTGQDVCQTTLRDIATIKYDSAGVEQWVARYDPPCGHAYPCAITVDDSGSVYITGRSPGLGTNWDYATVKYNSAGVEQCVARYNGPGNNDDRATAMVLDDAGNVYVTGGSEGSSTNIDYSTIKYSSLGIREDMLTRVKNSYLHTTIFSGPLQISEGKKCIVFDITGRVVEPSKITRGIYFIEIDGVVTQKVVKVR